MNLPTFPSLSPLALILLKWTILLVLAWITHFILRQHHARWRVILWRSIFCFGLAIPCLQFAPFSLYTITVEVDSAVSPSPSNHQMLPFTSQQNRTSGNTSPEEWPSISSPASHTIPDSPRVAAWIPNSFTIWLIGTVLGVLRLFSFALQLARLRARAVPASQTVHDLALELQDQLGVSKKLTIKVSESTRTPFLCGLRQPTIILPRPLLESLSQHGLSALLRHEIAHVRHNDLVWSIAWRCLTVLCWFHPLVWRIPSVHNLACEEEADRLATRHSLNVETYSRTLAELTLRVVSLPPLETNLTLNATSQIVQRIRALKRKLPAWRLRHSVASAALALLLLAVAAGGEFIPSKAAETGEPSPATGSLIVLVEDEDGKPLEGATLELWGYRVKGHDASSHYSFGSRKKFLTDSTGKGTVLYPIEANPDEKQLTGRLSFIVSHPDFATSTTELSVEGDAKTIRLERAATVEVTGYFGPNRQRVTDLVPNMSGDPNPKWTQKSPGVFTASQMPAGRYMLQLSGQSPTGKLIHSEAVHFHAETGKTHRFNLELKPGIRLIGKLDDNVPRPIRYGRVLISVRPTEFPAYVVPEIGGDLYRHYGYFQFWSSYRPIAEDGTFEFESIPPGEVDVIVLGEGFASKNGGQPMNRINGKLESGLVIGVPQSFPLSPPETTIIVATEAMATIEVLARTKSGEPIEGATIHVNPNVMRVQNGGIFGVADASNEAPFREIEFLPRPTYSVTTDEDGRAFLSNLPIVTRNLNLEHHEYAVPIDPLYQDRYIRFELAPGKTKELNLTLERKGVSHIGSLK